MPKWLPKYRVDAALGLPFGFAGTVSPEGAESMREWQRENAARVHAADERNKPGPLTAQAQRLAASWAEIERKHSHKLERTKDMDINVLKQKHPAVYEAVKATGTQDERDRCIAHLELGKQSGDMATAAKAIRSGDGMTETLQAAYMAAGMDRAKYRGRGHAWNHADSSHIDPPRGEAVADELERQMKATTPGKLKYRG